MLNLDQLLYFVCRIAMLMSLYTYAVKFNAIYEIQCQSMTYILKGTLPAFKSPPRSTKNVTVSDAIGVCGSSLILALRTCAVWHDDRRVTVGLGVMALVQIVLWGKSLSQYFRNTFLSLALIFVLHQLFNGRYQHGNTICARLLRPLLHGF